MIDAGNSDAFLVQIGAFSPRGSKEFLGDRLINHSYKQFSRLLKSDGDRKTWVAVSKIRGAVQGIHNPAIARIALLPASLLRHDSVLGEIGPQPAHNRLLRSAIRLRNDIHFALVADLYGTIEL